jgi:hypothetical protein
MTIMGSVCIMIIITVECVPRLFIVYRAYVALYRYEVPVVNDTDDQASRF